MDNEVTTCDKSAGNLYPEIPFSLPSMRGSRKFCQRGSNFDNVFFLFFN